MSPGGVVLFQDNIAAVLFEKNFNQAARVPVVINNQDASLFFQHRPRHTYSFERQPPCGGVPLIFLQAKARVKYPEDRPFQR